MDAQIRERNIIVPSSVREGRSRSKGVILSHQRSLVFCQSASSLPNTSEDDFDRMTKSVPDIGNEFDKIVNKRRKFTYQKSEPMLREYTEINSEDICKMISSSVRKSIQKYYNCDLLPVLNQDVRAQHEYRFTTSGDFDPMHGISYKSEYDFTMYDYAPFMFRIIRKRFGISEESYIKSLCGTKVTSNSKVSHNLLPMASEGKSCASFYTTKDSKLIIKSLRSNEFQKLNEIMRDYHEVCKKNKNPLHFLTFYFKFFRLHFVACFCPTKYFIM